MLRFWNSDERHGAAQSERVKERERERERERKRERKGPAQC